MILSVQPSGDLRGRVDLPASKSYSIRAFMIAACGGTSTIINPSNSDDGLAAIRAARFLGARVIRHRSARGFAWDVVARRRSVCPKLINVQESGTVLRFLLPLVALRGTKAMVTGEGTLRGRPNYFLTRSLRALGADVRGTGRNESIPITFRGGAIRGGAITIDGTLSSQFISALLIACPQIGQDSRLRITGKNLVSTDYIQMTTQLLKKSGVRIDRCSARDYRVKGNQAFKGLKNFHVPSDYGLAAFHMSAAVLNQADVRLTGAVDKSLVQADGHILAFLKRMGAELRLASQGMHIKGPCLLKGGKFSLADCPDLVPIMTILAMFARGTTCLYNISHVRSKESDRISDLRRELLKVGAKITETRDSITINPQSCYKSDCLLDPHRDHRLAMAFCVLGTKVAVHIKDIECVRKSYPDFVKDFRALGTFTRSRR